jgi:hypothetical protein
MPRYSSTVQGGGKRRDPGITFRGSTVGGGDIGMRKAHRPRQCSTPSILSNGAGQVAALLIAGLGHETKTQHDETERHKDDDQADHVRTRGQQAG